MPDHSPPDHVSTPCDRCPVDAGLPCPGYDGCPGTHPGLPPRATPADATGDPVVGGGVGEPRSSRSALFDAVVKVLWEQQGGQDWHPEDDARYDDLAEEAGRLADAIVAGGAHPRLPEGVTPAHVAATVDRIEGLPAFEPWSLAEDLDNWLYDQRERIHGAINVRPVIAVRDALDIIAGHRRAPAAPSSATTEWADTAALAEKLRATANHLAVCVEALEEHRRSGTSTVPTELAAALHVQDLCVIGESLVSPGSGTAPTSEDPA